LLLTSNAQKALDLFPGR